MNRSIVSAVSNELLPNVFYLNMRVVSRLLLLPRLEGRTDIGIVFRDGDGPTGIAFTHYFYLWMKHN